LDYECAFGCGDGCYCLELLVFTHGDYSLNELTMCMS
jgi:hypothetical protein